jgi:hypothetical protein
MLHQQVSIQGCAVNLEKGKIFLCWKQYFKKRRSEVRKGYSASASERHKSMNSGDIMVTNYTGLAFHCYGVSLKSHWLHF